MKTKDVRIHRLRISFDTHELSQLPFLKLGLRVETVGIVDVGKHFSDFVCFNGESSASSIGRENTTDYSLVAISRRILSATRSWDCFFRSIASSSRFASSASGSSSLARSNIVSRFRLRGGRQKSAFVSKKVRVKLLGNEYRFVDGSNNLFLRVGLVFR